MFSNLQIKGTRLFTLKSSGILMDVQEQQWEKKWTMQKGESGEIKNIQHTRREGKQEKLLWFIQTIQKNHKKFLFSIEIDAAGNQNKNSDERGEKSSFFYSSSTRPIIFSFLVSTQILFLSISHDKPIRN